MRSRFIMLTWYEQNMWGSWIKLLKLHIFFTSLSECFIIVKWNVYRRISGIFWPSRAVWSVFSRNYFRREAFKRGRGDKVVKGLFWQTIMYWKDLTNLNWIRIRKSRNPVHWPVVLQTAQNLRRPIDLNYLKAQWIITVPFCDEFWVERRTITLLVPLSLHFFSCRWTKNKIIYTYFKSLLTWRSGTPGRRGNPPNRGRKNSPRLYLFLRRSLWDRKHQVAEMRLRSETSWARVIISFLIFVDRAALKPS